MTRPLSSQAHSMKQLDINPVLGWVVVFGPDESVLEMRTFSKN